MKALLIVLALTACATEPDRTWQKPGASSTDFAMDQGQCQAQAFSVAPPATTQAVIVYTACMRGKGWQLR